jgi:hypothetical protein
MRVSNGVWRRRSKGILVFAFLLCPRPECEEDTHYPILEDIELKTECAAMVEQMSENIMKGDHEHGKGKRPTQYELSPSLRSFFSPAFR